MILPADINEKDADGYTVLHDAAINGYVDVIKQIMRVPGADVNVLSNDGLTPLHLAAIFNRGAAIKELVKVLGVFLNAQSPHTGFTPLHEAVMNNHVVAANVLCRTLGVNIRATDKNGLTPLHLAAFTGKGAVLRTMLRYKYTEVNVRCVNGHTPLHLAAKAADITTCYILLTTYGIDANAREDTKKMTPLHYAAACGNKEIIDVFTSTVYQGEHIVDVNARSIDGRTPLALAKAHKQQQAAQALRKAGAIM